ncbi:MAG TPA: outer membrane protein assembly factor BamE [Amaricoccus sp.]|nr:outer membrane protein assembly factor BamE [Amaricoccus sp.]
MGLYSLRSIGLALLLGGALAACAPTIQIHGYVPPETDVARIRPGFDDTGSVEKLLGRPSSSGVLADSAWYYVQSTVENYTYHAPKVIDRKVLAVNFDQRGVVKDVRRYGLADGRIIELDPATTATGGREMGVLEQLFGNILNLDAEALNAGAGN